MMLILRRARPPPSFSSGLLRPRTSIRYRSTSTLARSSLTSILIANRGEIALYGSPYVKLNSLMWCRRVGRTATQLGVRTTTIYTEPDAKSQHALSSPFAVNIGAPTAYLDGERIISIAKEHGCDSIHPGYGFVCPSPNDKGDLPLSCEIAE